MSLPEVGARVRIVRVENPDLAEFIGYEGHILKFAENTVMVHLDGLIYPMEFTVRDVVLI